MMLLLLLPHRHTASNISNPIEEDEGDPPHPGRAVRQPDRRQDLGGGLRRARHRRGLLRLIRTRRRAHGPRAGYYDSVRSGPYCNIFCPDNFIFGQWGPATTGPRATTRREQSSSTRCSMSSGRRQRTPTAYKVCCWFPSLPPDLC